jgi:hypothetical protein
MVSLPRVPVNDSAVAGAAIQKEVMVTAVTATPSLRIISMSFVWSDDFTQRDTKVDQQAVPVNQS